MLKFIHCVNKNICDVSETVSVSFFQYPKREAKQKTVLHASN
jgi:hypothetical protein